MVDFNATLADLPTSGGLPATVELSVEIADADMALVFGYLRSKVGFLDANGVVISEAAAAGDPAAIERGIENIVAERFAAFFDRHIRDAREWATTQNQPNTVGVDVGSMTIVRS